MSEESESSPEISPKPITDSAPRARKAATSRARKVSKTAAAVVEANDKSPAEIPAAPVETAGSTGAPVIESSSVEEAHNPAVGDWAESEGESTGGGQSPGESGKRKRRRRKGKGQSAQGQAPAGATNDESASPQNVEAKPADAPKDQGPRPNPQQQRPKIDPEDLAKMAWKIYLAEVSEEGVALIGDNDAKELSRRCFRLAEIFIEEQSRRR